MKVILLTGPPGVGKNTVAKMFASKRKRCAVIDGDDVRQMLITPHFAPFEGFEGSRQHRLGLRNNCLLAKSFAEDGCDVLILDVVSDELVQLYRKELPNFDLKVVVLMAEFDEVKRRNLEKHTKLTDEEIKQLYRGQVELSHIDVTIDATNISAQQVAEKLDQL